MKLYQLADDPETYADIAGQWLVVSDDLEDELAGPFTTRAEAAYWLVAAGGSLDSAGAPCDCDPDLPTQRCGRYCAGDCTPV